MLQQAAAPTWDVHHCCHLSKGGHKGPLVQGSDAQAGHRHQDLCPGSHVGPRHLGAVQQGDRCMGQLLCQLQSGGQLGSQNDNLLALLQVAARVTLQRLQAGNDSAGCGRARTTSDKVANI